MLSALLVALREGLEAALVVGICLAYLRKIGRGDLYRPVWYGVGAALVASLAGAALLEQFAWNQEAMEGFLLLVAAALLVTMIVWMRRVARTLRRQIEGEVERFVGRARFAALGLFLFVFFMVLREGIETVLLLGAVALNTEGLLLALGTLLGLAGAVALGVFFFQGTLPIRLDRFFDATSVMLLLIAVQLTLTGIHELAEAERIPSGPGMMRVLGPMVRNEVFFFVLLLATAAWLVLRELLYRRQAVPAGGNEAEQRLQRWQQHRERRWMTAAALTAFVLLVTLTADYVYARGAAELSPATPVEAASDTLRLPLAQFNDGTLHRFRLTHNGLTIRFIVIRQPSSDKLAVALDACQICGPQGYYQQGANVICKNCAAVIYTPSIGLPGGCNPIPLNSRVEAGELVIPVAELTAGRSFFPQP